MASKNFKPDKGAKITGGVASTFTGAVSDANSRGDGVSDSANVNAWAKHVNQIDWESPVAKTDNPNDDK